MATKTVNYNLVKPAGKEKVSIDVLNGNMDAIDTAMKGLDERTVTVANNLTTDEEGHALDAVQGKVLADQVTEVNSSLSAEITSVSNKIDNIPIATKIVNGLMSKEDKTKLDAMILQEAKMDLFNAGQAVPWNFIKSDSSSSGSIDNEKMSSTTSTPTSGTNYAGFCTGNKINVSDFNYIKFDRGTGASSRLGVSYYMALSTDNTPAASGAVAYLSNSKDGGNNAINISNLSGDYYIKVLCSCTSEGIYANMVVNKVTLENLN